MKKVILCILLTLNFSIGQAQKALRYFEINNKRAKEKASYKNVKRLIYFDTENKMIKRSLFKKRLSKHAFFQIPGDSLHHRKLIERQYHGQLTNYDNFIHLLQTDLGITVDTSKPLIIIYYPGKDRCNSSSYATKESRKLWHSQMIEGLSQLKVPKPIYIYHKDTKIERKFNFLNWYKDPQGIVERLFFPYHFPCGSFVGVSKNGRYFSVYGEYGKAAVWKTAKYLLEK